MVSLTVVASLSLIDGRIALAALFSSLISGLTLIVFSLEVFSPTNGMSLFHYHVVLLPCWVLVIPYIIWGAYAELLYIIHWHLLPATYFCLFEYFVNRSAIRGGQEQQSAPGPPEISEEQSSQLQDTQARRRDLWESLFFVHGIVGFVFQFLVILFLDMETVIMQMLFYLWVLVSTIDYFLILMVTYGAHLSKRKHILLACVLTFVVLVGAVISCSLKFSWGVEGSFLGIYLLLPFLIFVGFRAFQEKLIFWGTAGEQSVLEVTQVYCAFLHGSCYYWSIGTICALVGYLFSDEIEWVILAILMAFGTCLVPFLQIFWLEWWGSTFPRELPMESEEEEETEKKLIPSRDLFICILPSLCILLLSLSLFLWSFSFWLRRGDWPEKPLFAMIYLFWYSIFCYGPLISFTAPLPIEIYIGERGAFYLWIMSWISGFAGGFLSLFCLVIVLGPMSLVISWSVIGIVSLFLTIIFSISQRYERMERERREEARMNARLKEVQLVKRAKVEGTLDVPEHQL